MKRDEKDGVFKAKVMIDEAYAKNGKVFYKFVVDGEWKFDHTLPVETDASGNINNVLLIPVNSSKLSDKVIEDVVYHSMHQKALPHVPKSEKKIGQVPVIELNMKDVFQKATLPPVAKAAEKVTIKIAGGSAAGLKRKTRK